MAAHRVLAVIAAVLLVGAVALATLGPPSVPLGQLLFMIDHDTTNRVQGWVLHYLGNWVWRFGVSPVLVRPAWLVPAALGLVCLGASLTLSTRKPAHRSHRRS